MLKLQLKGRTNAPLKLPNYNIQMVYKSAIVPIGDKFAQWLSAKNLYSLSGREKDNRPIVVCADGRAVCYYIKNS